MMRLASSFSDAISVRISAICFDNSDVLLVAVVVAVVVDIAVEVGRSLVESSLVAEAAADATRRCGNDDEKAEAKNVVVDDDVIFVFVLVVAIEATATTTNTTKISMIVIAR